MADRSLRSGQSLPIGTVTFLFTDVEGSTALWERDAAVMRAALARHDALLRGAIAGHGGQVFKTIGDSFCAAFSTAPTALAAAVEAQRLLIAEPWPNTGRLRVRMALHSGAADVQDGDYAGACLNRLARLLAIGHGDQILVSQACCDLARDALPDGVNLRDLGEQRLRDLTRPERTYQALHQDLPAEFPSLRSLDAVPNNLPRQATPLVGREQQLQALRARVVRDDVRLLTLTGPGGTGKTRLALQAAADLLDAFPDGAYFVSLAPVTDPDLVPSAIARALELKESPGRSVLGSLEDHLRNKALLLVVDNFEHVAAAAPMVAGLLAASPRLKVLATSRAVLQLYGEHDFPVPPLALPDRRPRPTAQHVSLYESVRLFVARVQAARPDFSLTDENAGAVAEICHRLDGLPLAIELAAARLRALPLLALLARMARRLPLLTGGPRDLPARQRTLRDAIAWSYELLDPSEQTLFRRLAVFHGCTLEAVEAICCAASTQPGSSSIAVPGLDLDALDGVESLVNQSLLRQEATTDGQPWYVMLETVREYALERLDESAEADAIRRRHVMYFLRLAESADPELVGSEQSAWFARLEREHDNLRAAVGWSESRGYAEPALRLGVALWWFWAVHGHLSEGRRTLAGLLARFQPRDASSRHVSARARALQAAGYLAGFQNDYAAARELHEESLRVFRGLGDTAGVESALDALGQVAALQGDHQAARELIEEALALARERGDLGAVAAVLANLAHVAHQQGDFAIARVLIEEAVAVKREIAGPRELAFHQLNLGTLLEAQRDFALARAMYEQSLAGLRQAGDRRTAALALANVGGVATAQGDYVTARSSLVESMAIHQELGDPAGIALVLERFAELAAAQAQYTGAVRLLAAATTLRDSIDARLSPEAQAALDRKIDPARRSLGQPAANAAWAAGRAMSLEEAIEQALQAEGPARRDREQVRFAGSGDARGQTLCPGPSPLTPREGQVAALIARGYTNRQIAAELVITEGTAANHVVHILNKLGVGSRAQVAVWAAEHGLLVSDASPTV